MALLYPKQYVSSLFDVDPDDLLRRGIRGILFDLDNTIVPRDVSRCPREITAWLEKLKQHGFKICIVSNNNTQRVRLVADALAVPAVCHAIKPLKRPFRRAMELMGTGPHETAIIGDQIFTDILGGNRLGLYTVLVSPLPGREFWATRLFNRRMEKFVLSRLKKRSYW
ncbi:YqeG family HAD IIIA-type phosphatase [Desulfotomaculum copahuensis]|uniref:YqeG family HAD IIIA-type phosphatase n=1 Tax=Desulfotomaculum copahuensis TaxID=1838280 RepID=UPI000A95AA65